ncbi:hypothetical protein NMY22_g11204 [Coprinellus aureogranulatus]|nr:hypothetical protein NMY22_g11204 [Coprinellus aureogranulatus]
MSSPIPLNAEEESLISFIIQEELELEEMTNEYHAELTKDMNAHAEAYIAATTTMEPLIDSYKEEFQEAEILRLSELRKSWLADPNANLKDILQHQLTAAEMATALRWFTPVVVNGVTIFLYSGDLEPVAPTDPAWVSNRCPHCHHLQDGLP